METIPADTLALLQGILETLKQAKADREKSTWLLLRCREEVTSPALQQALDEYLADASVVEAEDDAVEIIEGLV